MVVEEFLDGEEASFFALIDGDSAVALASAQDHKAAGDGDTGPNTGQDNGWMMLWPFKLCSDLIMSWSNHATHLFLSSTIFLAHAQSVGMRHSLCPFIIWLCCASSVATAITLSSCALVLVLPYTLSAPKPLIS